MLFTLKFLARQGNKYLLYYVRFAVTKLFTFVLIGLPLRGHGSESDSIFIQLLKLQSIDDKQIITWLGKKTDKYMHSEILKVMALNVLRQVTLSIQSAPFFSVMVDETTDISNKEQVVICFRWVDKQLEAAHEEFTGLCLVESTQANVLHSVIRDVLQRFNLTITKLRGQF